MAGLIPDLRVARSVALCWPYGGGRGIYERGIVKGELGGIRDVALPTNLGHRCPASREAFREFDHPP